MQLHIVDAYFSKSKEDTITWMCKCGTKWKRKGSGYSIMLSHIIGQRSHQLHSAARSAENLNSKSDSLLFVRNRRAVNTHSWIEMIVMELQPFSCEKKYILRYVNVALISIDTFKKYITRLFNHVERKTAKALPLRFSLVFNGWSIADSHFLGILAIFLTQERSGTGFNDYNFVLLAFSPLEDNFRLNADDQISFIHLVLKLFDKIISNVIVTLWYQTAVRIAEPFLQH